VLVNRALGARTRYQLEDESENGQTRTHERRGGQVGWFGQLRHRYIVVEKTLALQRLQEKRKHALAHVSTQRPLVGFGVIALTSAQSADIAQIRDTMTFTIFCEQGHKERSSPRTMGFYTFSGASHWFALSKSRGQCVTRGYAA